MKFICYSFTLQLSNLYYWKFFLQPLLLTFSVSLAIFFYLYVSESNCVGFLKTFVKIEPFNISLQVDWTSGLGTAFLTYTQLYILCDIGNEVESAVTQCFSFF